MIERVKSEFIYYTEEGLEQSVEVQAKFLTPRSRVEFLKLKEPISKKGSELTLKFNEKTNAYAKLTNKTKPEEREAIEREWSEANDELMQFVIKSNNTLFQFIVDKSKLTEELKALIETDTESDFWQNVASESVAELVKSFRTRHSI